MTRSSTDDVAKLVALLRGCDVLADKPKWAELGEAASLIERQQAELREKDDVEMEKDAARWTTDIGMLHAEIGSLALHVETLTAERDALREALCERVIVWTALGDGRCYWECGLCGKRALVDDGPEKHAPGCLAAPPVSAKG